MKLLTQNVFTLILISLCINACSSESLNIEESLKSSGSKLHIIQKSTENTSLIIYDSKDTGLGLFPVELKKRSGNIKKDIVTAFLNHNHFLDHKDQIALSKIEEVGNSTTFYLNTVQELQHPERLPLFKKALELTIMRQLKNKDFNIIYGQTAQL